jgi:hypothetical protein
MPLKDTWKPKIDLVDDVMADDINSIADAVIDMEENGVNAEQVQGAVNEALKNAKKSGEFDGDDGKSAYEVACDNGFEGTEQDWLASLQGVGDMGGVQYKTAVVIGNSANGATADTCDVLYNVGDNFATTFSVAYEQATSYGINRIGILEGAYELANSIQLGHGIDIIGIGANPPQLSMKIRDSAPIRPYAQIFFTGGNEGEVYRFENIYFDDGGDLAAFHIENGALTLKNVWSEYVALNHNIIVSQYPESLCIENCIFGELILDNAKNSHIMHSSIYILSLGTETSENIITGNSISELADDGENNVIQNNIINGIPQVNTGGNSEAILLFDMRIDENGDLICDYAGTENRPFEIKEDGCLYFNTGDE